MSLRMIGTEWEARFERGRHGYPDFVWYAANNAEGTLSIHMCSGARFFVNWRSGSDLSCSQAFPKFEDAVEYAFDNFQWERCGFRIRPAFPEYRDSYYVD